MKTHSSTKVKYMAYTGGVLYTLFSTEHVPTIMGPTTSLSHSHIVNNLRSFLIESLKVYSKAYEATSLNIREYSGSKIRETYLFVYLSTYSTLLVLQPLEK